MNLPGYFQENKPLNALTTIGIGGKACYFVEVKTVEQMQEVLVFCNSHQLNFFILGKGSNVLLDDKGFNGVVIANRISVMDQSPDGLFYAGAGYSFSLLGSQTARQGWSGLEFASGIPGSVGGAVYMNAGANGKETCETLVYVDFVTMDGNLLRINRSELDYQYRFSSFQKMRGAIVGAAFQLELLESARKKQLEIIQYRTETQPYKDKSAGCIFRNPPSKSAGALIEQSQLKGSRVGGAEVSAVHANFIVNVGDASSADVLNLIELIKKTVKAKMDVELESEVRYIAYD